MLQQVHVALVGGEDVHRRRTEQGVSGFLEDDCLADVGEAEAAVFEADVRRDQTLGGGQCHQLLTEWLGWAVRGLAVVLLQRNDLVADESPDAALQLLQFGGEGEIHAAILG